jgi:hypothetical protein
MYATFESIKVKMVINISGGVANMFYQSCAQIDNNQQVYEARIRCTGEHTNHGHKATYLNVCMLSSVWARSYFWIDVSTPHQIFPHPLFLFTLYFIIIITIFTFILSNVAYIR